MEDHAFLFRQNNLVVFPTSPLNIGVMPRDGEIAITPSLAKQFAQDIRTLIGKEIVFSCGKFSRKLQISGIYSGSFDDYYLDAKTEQELYGTLQGDESPCIGDLSGQRL